MASHKASASAEPVASFSLAFEEQAYDESSYQQVVAQALGTNHHVMRCTAQDIGDAFEEVVWHAERPLLRTAPAPMRLLSRLVHDQGYKVVLTGEGADEVFGGYDLFREAAVRRFLARHPGLKVGDRLLRSLYPYMPELGSQPGSFVNRFFEVDALDVKDPFYAHRPRMRVTGGLSNLLSADTRSRIAAQEKESRWLAHLPFDFDVWHPLDQAQYLEGTILMPGYILSSQGDRMAMASAVEGRFPFLDHRVLAFAAKLPPSMRLFGLKEKWLLKKAASRLVPPAIVSRPKQPYMAPDAPSLLRGQGSRGGPLLAFLEPNRVKNAGIFHPPAVATLVERLTTSRHPARVRDAMALTLVLSVQILHARFIAS